MMRILLLPLTLLFATASLAQTSSISLDGSLPHGRTDVLTGPGTGPDYTIGEDLGWRAGPNLFHSFNNFSIGVNESATFTENPGMPALSHVIARVTGGSPSLIDGALRSEIAGADFYFLNPSGVLFGGTASIDVPASFVVSTAHRLDFEGTNASLDLLDANEPSLRVEPPSSFGFLDTGPRSLIEFGNADANVPLQHRFATGSGVSAVGGDVTIQNGVTLNAPQGRIRIAAVGASTVDVPKTVDGADPGGMSGTVSVLRNSALLSLGDGDTGTVVIRGGRLVLAEGSAIRATGAAGGDGGSIDIATSSSVEISGFDTLLRSEATRESSGGIRIASHDVAISDEAQLSTLVRASDPAVTGGDLQIEADTIEISNGALVGTVAQRTGSAGDVRLAGLAGAASRIALLDDSILESQNGTDAPGGNLDLFASTVEISDSSIASRSTAGGSAGAISIRSDDVRLGRFSKVDSIVSAAPVAGDAGGNIFIGSGDVRVGSIVVEEGASIATQTTGPNRGGSIELHSGSIRVTGENAGFALIEASTLGAGDGGDIRITADSVEMTAGEGAALAGQIAALVAEDATGVGGSIEMEVGSLHLADGAQISTTNFGGGRAGGIEIRASRDVSIEGGAGALDFFASGIFSVSEDRGDGGTVAIDAQSIALTGGATISTRALGTGTPGDIDLRARDLLRVAGVGGPRNSAAAAQTLVTARGSTELGAGPGGSIDIEAGRVEVVDGGRIDASAGWNRGGSVTIDARDVLVAGRHPTGFEAEIAADALGSGQGGSIFLSSSSIEVGAGGRVSVSSVEPFATGNTGDISISSGNVLVRGTIAAEARESDGGDISIRGGNAIRIDGGEARIRADDGNAGSIRLEAPQVVLSRAKIDADAGRFGGNVEIIASELVHLVDSEISAVSRGGANATGLAGGNIFIDPPAVVVSNSIISANGLGNANGGNIFIAGNPLLVSGDSAITASSQFGTQGQVVVSSPNAEITGELAALPTDFLDASSLLAESCLARDEVSGTFSVRSTRTLPPPPDAPFAPDAGSSGQQCEAP